MANTYYVTENPGKQKEKLALTAYVGRDGEKCVTLTVGYGLECQEFKMTELQAQRLVGALMERLTGVVTATGAEYSAFEDRM